MLQACLGISIEGASKQVHIDRPMLPQGIESLTVRDLPVKDESIDLQFQRIGDEGVVVPTRHLEQGVRVIGHL
jgi:hypothetical protein